MLYPEEEPICNKLIPKMMQADLKIPKPTTTERSGSNSNERGNNQLIKSNNHLKNLSIQTDLIANNKIAKSFDLKKYLNRNSPKYYNLKEKLLTFQNSVKNKNSPIPFIQPSNNTKRDITPPLNPKNGISFIEQSANKNTQNSTIDQTPKPRDHEDSRKSFTKQEEHEMDYENNFIIAKINNFFKNDNKTDNSKKIDKNEQKPKPKKKNSSNHVSKDLQEIRSQTPTPQKTLQKTPQKTKEDINNNDELLTKKKLDRNKVKSEERPQSTGNNKKITNFCSTTREKQLKKKSLEKDQNAKLAANSLFQITENSENEDFHNRYEKELKSLLGKDVLEVEKKKQKNHKSFNNSISSGTTKYKEKDSISLEKSKGNSIKPEKKENKKSIENKEEKRKEPKEKKRKTKEEIKNEKSSNGIIYFNNDGEEVKTREKKKTLEKFITQINRGEIFAKPIEDSEEKQTKRVTKKINNKLVDKANGNGQKAKNQQKNGKKAGDSDKNVKPVMQKNKFIFYSTNLALAYKSLDSNDYFVQLYKEHFSQTFQALSYCKGIKSIEADQIEEKKVNLKKRETHLNKKTLIFDLDETLIHCNELMDVPSDVILPITFPNGEIIEAGINIRPYLYDVLHALKELFEIIVFTASHNCYANKVLDYLDPKEELIHHRLFREHCVVTEEGIHIKDLRVIANRKIEDIVIVDNACYSFGYHIDNGIPIIPYYDNKSDEELKNLLDYLKNLVKNDIRETNRNAFKLGMFQKFQTIEDLAEVLFEEN